VLKEKDPTLKAPDVLRALGALWKEQTEDKKQPFIEKAKIAKAEYEKAIAEYKGKKKQEADDEDDGGDDEEED
jgi:ABC-type transporter MlaC component